MKQLIPIFYFAATHIAIPLVLLGWAVTLQKNYSLRGMIHVYFATFLIALPLTQFLLIGFAATGRSQVTPVVLLTSFIPAIIIAFFLGLIGLILNSIYILFLRIFIKA